jgi:hypothetical protein
VISVPKNKKLSSKNKRRRIACCLHNRKCKFTSFCYAWRCVLHTNAFSSSLSADDYSVLRFRFFLLLPYFPLCLIICPIFLVFLVSLFTFSLIPTFLLSLFLERYYRHLGSDLELLPGFIRLNIKRGFLLVL